MHVLSARFTAWMALAFLCGAMVTVHAQEAGTLTGQVLDAETGQPIPGVNVYLAHTTRGGATDADGRYAITSVALGSYELVASMLGYAAEAVQVIVVPGRPQPAINLRLTPQVYDLDGVEVTARRSRDWQRRFNQFEELFLGTSNNGEETEILNPYVLSFEVDRLTRMLTATASAPLEIENRALGYHLTFVLRQFRWDPHKEQLTLLGLPYFEALAPEQEEQARAWTERRADAFKGSMPHLLRAMIAGRTFEEGFQLRLQEPTTTRPVTAADLLRKAETGSIHELSFNGMLQVSYQGHLGRGGFLRRKSRELHYAMSLGTYLAFVNEDGHVLPAGAVRTYRYPKRVADLLPRTYGLDSLATP